MLPKHLLGFILMRLLLFARGKIILIKELFLDLIKVLLCSLDVAQALRIVLIFLK